MVKGDERGDVVLNPIGFLNCLQTDLVERAANANEPPKANLEGSSA